MSQIKFGTDGWRGIIADDFTFDNVRVVAQAIADYLKSTAVNPAVSVGYDTRFLSSTYAGLVSEVLAGNNIKVFLSDAVSPTPAVSFLVKHKKLSGGVMITASHNPPKYNGIKFKTRNAGPADPSVTGKIEKLLSKTKPKLISFPEAEKKKYIKVCDFKKPYLNYVCSYVDINAIKKANLRVACDSMWGCGIGYLKEALKGKVKEFTEIHSNPDPLFNGYLPEPIEKNLQEFVTLMKNSRYALGIATDGDADRIGVVRPDGRFVSSGEIICLLMVHFYEDKKWRGPVAKTISGTSLIEKLAGKYKLKLHETPVGFKHISKLMSTGSILVGGEESGGIGFKNYIPERDGIAAGMLLLEMMAQRKKGIIKIMDQIEKEFGRYYYLREDIHYPKDKMVKLHPFILKNRPMSLLGEKIKEIKTYDGIKLIGKDGSFLLFRLSGTEPILRIYTESLSKKKSSRLMELGKQLASIVK